MEVAVDAVGIVSRVLAADAGKQLSRCGDQVQESSSCRASPMAMGKLDLLMTGLTMLAFRDRMEVEDSMGDAVGVADGPPWTAAEVDDGVGVAEDTAAAPERMQRPTKQGVYL